MYTTGRSAAVTAVTVMLPPQLPSTLLTVLTSVAVLYTISSVPSVYVTGRPADVTAVAAMLPLPSLALLTVLTSVAVLCRSLSLDSSIDFAEEAEELDCVSILLLSSDSS